jgi:hypothetical protein
MPEPTVNGEPENYEATAWVTFARIACDVREKTDTAATVEQNAEQAAGNPFHDLIEKGSLAELEAALKNDADVNSAGRLGSTPLMVAIKIKDLAKLNMLLSHGADPELTDDLNGTALRNAVHHDFVEGVARLLELGVDRGHQPKYPLKKISYPEMPIELEVPPELKDFFTKAEWAESQKDSAEVIRKMGENPTVEPIINDVESIAVLKLFLAAGEELNHAPVELRRTYIGLGNGGEFQATPQEYRRVKFPHFGSANPERMEHPFWRDMVRLGVNAYEARQHYHDTEAVTDPHCVWCFDRFGSTLTALADGRFIQVGGEHEDHYDPDFNIYNDVVVHDGRGGFEIYGYPKDVFSPTDFHSATLVGESIYIIGSLGYPDQRKRGFTPVYRLDAKSLQIDEVRTSGEYPGWLHGHRALHIPDSHAIRIQGGQLDPGGTSGLTPSLDTFELDLESLVWRLVKTAGQ